MDLSYVLISILQSSKHYPSPGLHIIQEIMKLRG